MEYIEERMWYEEFFPEIWIEDYKKESIAGEDCRVKGFHDKVKKHTSTFCWWNDPQKETLEIRERSDNTPK